MSGDAAGEAEPGFPVKLLVDKSTKEIMYLEAESEFADMLINIMQMPIGGLIGFLAGDEKDLSVVNICSPALAIAKSLEELPEAVFKNAKVVHQTLSKLSRTNANANMNDTGIIMSGMHPITPVQHTNFRCHNCQQIARHNRKTCHCCHGARCASCCTAQCTASSPSSHAHPNLTFIVAEDLSVRKSSTVACIDLINARKASESIVSACNISDLCGVDTLATRPKVVKLVEAILDCNELALTHAFKEDVDAFAAAKGARHSGRAASAAVSARHSGRAASAAVSAGV